MYNELGVDKSTKTRNNSITALLSEKIPTLHLAIYDMSM